MGWFSDLFNKKKVKVVDENMPTFILPERFYDVQDFLAEMEVHGTLVYPCVFKIASKPKFIKVANNRGDMMDMIVELYQKWGYTEMTNS